jgi:hypothetical protein
VSRVRIPSLAPSFSGQNFLYIIHAAAKRRRHAAGTNQTQWRRLLWADVCVAEGGEISAFIAFGFDSVGFI